jgi:hypothetical protein
MLSHARDDAILLQVERSVHHHVTINI